MAHTHTIDCSEALAKLYDYIDGELDSVDRDAFQAHLEFCRPCLSYYEFERYFTEFVKRHTPLPCVREEFKSRLMARLSDERRVLECAAPQPRSAARFTHLMARFALAAVVILALGAVVRWMGHRSASGVDWALLAGYHLGTAQVEREGLDTSDFAAARAFVVSRLGPSAESALPRRLPAGLSCKAARLLPWGDRQLAQFRWRAGADEVSMFIIPVDTLSPAFEPEHRPRITVEDRDYHMMSLGDVKALCWKPSPKGQGPEATRTHMCVMMGTADFGKILAWAESVRRDVSLWSGDSPGWLGVKAAD